MFLSVLAKYRGSSASIEDYVASHRSLDGWGRPKDPSDAYMSEREISPELC